MFRYQEPEKTKSKTVITNFIMPIERDNVPPLKHCQIECNNKEFELKTTTDNEIEATVKNELSQSKKSAMIYVYADKYLSQCLGAAKVEIEAAVAFQMQVKAGEEVPYNLTIDNPAWKNPNAKDKKTMVEVYSSDPTLVYGPRGVGLRNIHVMEGKLEKVPIHIKSRSHGMQRARVTVVDINSQSIL